MNTTYSEAFIEQALVKVYSRGDRTISAIAHELNVNFYTMKSWMKSRKTESLKGAPLKERRPLDWSAEQRLVALQESYGLTGEALNMWCRERGLFAHDLTSWRSAFCAPSAAVASSSGDLRQLRDENEKLKRELNRKEHALAEAAALLVLQKKFRALWEDEVE
jgi:transposase